MKNKKEQGITIDNKFCSIRDELKIKNKLKKNWYHKGIKVADLLSGRWISSGAGLQGLLLHPERAMQHDKMKLGGFRLWNKEF